MPHPNPTPHCGNPSSWRRLLASALMLALVAPAGLALAAESPDRSGASVSTVLMAESSADVEDYSGYSWRYYFALTRGVSRSTMVTPLKPPLFLLTIPVDIVLLPFSAIGGFF